MAIKITIQIEIESTAAEKAQPDFRTIGVELLRTAGLRDYRDNFSEEELVRIGERFAAELAQQIGTSSVVSIDRNRKRG